MYGKHPGSGEPRLDNLFGTTTMLPVVHAAFRWAQWYTVIKRFNADAVLLNEGNGKAGSR